MSSKWSNGKLIGKKPQPLFPAQARTICPVCGQNSYSQGGVHPQCEMNRFDNSHRQQLKAVQK